MRFGKRRHLNVRLEGCASKWLLICIIPMSEKGCALVICCYLASSFVGISTQRICINEIMPSLILYFVFLYILAANCTSSHKNSNHQQGERQLENAVTHSEEMNDETLMSYRDRITDTNELHFINIVYSSCTSRLVFWGGPSAEPTLEPTLVPTVEPTGSEVQTTIITITITELSWTVANNSEALRLGMRTALSNLLLININQVQRYHCKIAGCRNERVQCVL